MSWIQESKRTWLERFCISVLKAGKIPKHVAFIMDGNRRYATKNGMKKLEGHALGFNKLSETLEWCLDLGITEVTIYTFSIENFKRPKEEVNCLMNLAREKVKELLEQRDKLEKYGVCIRVFGDITLLPVDLQILVAEAVLESYHNTKTHLNICLAYTSREEITAAVKELATEVVEGNLVESDINEHLIYQSLYSYKTQDPDIIVRTSGEVRLSDFLLWQSSYSVLSFHKVLWPEFSIWDLFLVVLYYQQNCDDLIEMKKQHNMKNILHEKQLEADSAFEQFLELSEKHHSYSQDSHLAKYKKDATERREKYLSSLDKKRYDSLVQIKEGKTTQAVPPIS